MHRTRAIVFLLVFMLSACGLASPTPVPPTETARPTANTTIPTAIPPTATPATSDQVEDMLGQMTQVVWWSFQPGDVTRYSFGSVFAQIFERDWTTKITSYRQEALASRLGIPILYGVDAIHGNAFLLGAT